MERLCFHCIQLYYSLSTLKYFFMKMITADSLVVVQFKRFRDKTSTNVLQPTFEAQFSLRWIRKFKIMSFCIFIFCPDVTLNKCLKSLKNYLPRLFFRNQIFLYQFRDVTLWHQHQFICSTAHLRIISISNQHQHTSALASASASAHLLIIDH